MIIAEFFPHLAGFFAFILNPFNLHFWPSSESHSSPSNWARELFKPFKYAASLVDSIKNGFWVFCGWCHKAVLRFF